MNKEEFLKMTTEEYDQYMCSKYPKLFINRHKPMSETCMCWGFDIGRGWYADLDELCQHLTFISSVTNIFIIADQIKEKLGSARYYFHEEYPTEMTELEKKTWGNIIHTIISEYEARSEHTCSVTGEYYYHEHIKIHGWIYDMSPNGYLKAFPDKKNLLNDWFERCKLKEEIKMKMESMSVEQLKALDESIKN